jgi:hypothetical protein
MWGTLIFVCPTHRAVVGLRPSFSSHVRFGQRGAPVDFLRRGFLRRVPFDDVSFDDVSFDDVSFDDVSFDDVSSDDVSSDEVMDFLRRG